MRVFTAHTRPGRPPVLLREGFSLWAAVFGPLWLLAHGAWLPALLLACADAAIGLATHGAPATVLGLALAWLVGLCGRDMVRWSLERRGFSLAHVVTGRDHEAALARLLDQQPWLRAGFAS